MTVVADKSKFNKSEDTEVTDVVCLMTYYYDVTVKGQEGPPDPNTPLRIFCVAHGARRGTGLASCSI